MGITLAETVTDGDCDSDSDSDNDSDHWTIFNSELLQIAYKSLGAEP